MNNHSSFRSGIHYISVLETGCQELEALTNLTSVHFNMGVEAKTTEDRIIAMATTDAVCQLACIKANALLFDTTDKAASLKNLLKVDPLNSGSDDLTKRASEIVMFANIGGTDGILHARPLTMDETKREKALIDINLERSKALHSGHANILVKFVELESEATSLSFKVIRDRWQAHASLEAGKLMFMQQFNPPLHDFLIRCARLLRLAVETYKPAVFIREGRMTWNRVNELVAPQGQTSGDQPT